MCACKLPDVSESRVGYNCATLATALTQAKTRQRNGEAEWRSW
jgi:hypothetical protein